jgi:catabolite regulation protein CreA
MQVKESLLVKEKKRKISKEKIEIIFKKKSVAQFFGIDKNEVDGLTYQKKVRNEWK